MTAASLAPVTGEASWSFAAAVADSVLVKAAAPVIEPMQVEYMHKYSHLFTLLGRSAVPGKEHRQLCMVVYSGPSDELDGGGGGQRSSLKPPASMKDVNNEG